MHDSLATNDDSNQERPHQLSSNSSSLKRPRDSGSDYSSPRHHQHRRYNDRGHHPHPRDHPRRRTASHHPISVAQQITDNFLKSVWCLGDSERFDFRQEIPDLVQRIESHFYQLQLPNDVLKAFRIAAAELPHKLPHLALLISFLSVPPPPISVPDSKEPPTASIGVQIIRDLARAFQLHIDNRRWRSTRLYLHLFGHLHALSRPLVSSQSLLALLRAIFSATTDELTCTGARADECLRIVCEGLLRSNLLGTEDSDLKKEVNELVDSIRVHMVVNRRLDRSLFNEPDSLSQYIDPIEELVAALDGAPQVDILPVLDEAFNPLLELRINSSSVESPYPKPFDLPIVLLPPDAEEPGLEAHPPAPKTPSLSTGPGPIPLDSKDRTNYLGVKLLLRLFSENTVPVRATANGVILRTLVNDVIDIFEVNRKECAKILLELPRWVGRGTFKTKTASKPKPDEEGNGVEQSIPKGSDWVLEHILLESILTSVFAIPTPPIRPTVYYYSLIVELCRLSPSTVAPALGKSVRRLYGGLGESGAELITTRLEPEGVRRLAEWFGVHLSNFGFLWAWKDWAEVAELPLAHPKRVFVTRVIELEIRLSYYDRIKETVPTLFLDTGLMPAEAPGPTFEYEDSAHRDNLAALDVVHLLKRKEPVSRLLDYITKMQERLRNEGVPEPVEDVTRDVTIQSLLNVGSRSFSHFLNVLERYLDLLRTLTNSTGARASLLSTVSKFWRRNGQFELIVIDKLLEYRVIDPIDSLRHSFEARESSSWGEIQFWDGLKLTIEKVTTRVKVSRSKLEKLRKDEEDQRDLQRAAGGEIMEQANGTANLVDINMKDGAEAEESKKEAIGGDHIPKENEPETSSKVIDKKELESMRRDEIARAEVELEANLAEQVVVLAEAIIQFSLARQGAEEKVGREHHRLQNDDDDDHDNDNRSKSEDEGSRSVDKANAFWKAWWLRGWCRELYRSFGNEISTHCEQIVEKLNAHQLSSNEIESTHNGHGHNHVSRIDERTFEELKIAKDWVETVGFSSI